MNPRSLKISRLLVVTVAVAMSLTYARAESTASTTSSTSSATSSSSSSTSASTSTTISVGSLGSKAPESPSLGGGIKGLSTVGEAKSVKLGELPEIKLTGLGNLTPVQAGNGAGEAPAAASAPMGGHGGLTPATAPTTARRLLANVGGGLQVSGPRMYGPARGSSRAAKTDKFESAVAVTKVKRTRRFMETAAPSTLGDGEDGGHRGN